MYEQILAVFSVIQICVVIFAVREIIRYRRYMNLVEKYNQGHQKFQEILQERSCNTIEESLESFKKAK